VKVAVVQLRIRVHVRMDLAALLDATERAADEGAEVIVYPYVPWLTGQPLLDPFFASLEQRVPDIKWVRPGWRSSGDSIAARPTALGSTVLLEGDDCIDPAHFPLLRELGCDTLVWLFDAEDDLQAEALLELALEASVTMAPLVVIASLTGDARGIRQYGASAIVHGGEILAEADAEDEIVMADVPRDTPPLAHGHALPEPAPVLAQRLAAHRHTKVKVDYPADLS
jgi:predicted amidohydrolase